MKEIKTLVGNHEVSMFEVNKTELADAGCFNVCCGCNEQFNKGILNPMVNDFQCDKCFSDWLDTAKWYDEDEEYIEANVKEFRHRLTGKDEYTPSFKLGDKARLRIDAGDGMSDYQLDGSGADLAGIMAGALAGFCEIIANKESEVGPLDVLGDIGHTAMMILQDKGYTSDAVDAAKGTVDMVEVLLDSILKEDIKNEVPPEIKSILRKKGGKKNESLN